MGAYSKKYVCEYQSVEHREIVSGSLSDMRLQLREEESVISELETAGICIADDFTCHCGW